MNNPEDAPVDVNEQRDWLLEHKRVTGSSWTQLAAVTGIKTGTLSAFGGKTYAGNNEKIAQQIFRYRQHLVTQAELAVEAPEVPGYFETPTSRRVQALLTNAHRGRIVVVAAGPGCSKTTAAENYRDSMSNVWMATMRPSCSGINSMQIEVLAKLGERDARGSMQQLSRRICDRVQDRNGLLIFDEAQHLLDRTIDEIRSWHDETGVGIAFLGNNDVLARIEGGHRKAAFAQLYSRIGMRLVQNTPLADDARALAEAWNVHDPKQIEFIVKKSQQPGGLRTVTMMLEAATMIAAASKRERELADLQGAWAQLVSRPLDA